MVKHNEALLAAAKVVDELRPFCEKGPTIAGSLRRGKADVGDIEVVCIPKPYDVGLFESGIATVVERWPKVRGELPCKYTRRELPDGIELDLFFATRENWANILAIRTGSAAWVAKVLAARWMELGYHSKGGILERDGEQAIVKTEEELFDLLGMEWVDPGDREVEDEG